MRIGLAHRWTYSLTAVLTGLCLILTAVLACLLWTYKPLLADLRNVQVNLKQQITASLDSPFPVDIAFDHRFDIRLRKDIPLELPIRTTLQVPVDETFLIPIENAFAVQVATPLFIDEQIRVRSEMPLDITVQARILGMDVSIPIKGSVPIDLAFPLRQEIGVQGAVSLRVTDPLQIHVRQALDVPLDFVLRSVLPLDEQISVPIETAMEGTIAIPDPLPCTVKMNVTAQDWRQGIRITR